MLPFSLETLLVVVVLTVAVLSTLVNVVTSGDEQSTRLEQARETVQADYEAGRIDHEQFEQRLDLLYDAGTEAVFHTTRTIDGIGGETAYELAVTYDDLAQLRCAAVGAADPALESVNGVGLNRAQAIQSRLSTPESEV
jgi:competence protein ComGC